jgi:hypothetical protein
VGGRQRRAPIDVTGAVSGKPATSATAAPESSTSTGRASASMNAIRSAGRSGSTGTYAAPALSTASTATTSSTERGNDTATHRSGPAPAAISRCARRFARASRSA